MCGFIMSLSTSKPAYQLRCIFDHIYFRVSVLFKLGRERKFISNIFYPHSKSFQTIPYILSEYILNPSIYFDCFTSICFKIGQEVDTSC